MKWRPIGPRKARVVLWGFVHNHARGKFEAIRKLSDDFELVGIVDDSASTAMRMSEPDMAYWAPWPRVDGDAVLRGEVPCDLVVIECSNSELVGIATRIAEAGIPMHMDKPLGTDQAGFRRMSGICEGRGIPLQIGYMFRANAAINKMVELARVESLDVHLLLRTVNEAARAAGFREGANVLSFPAPDDRYAGQLHELARIVRGELPYPPGLYRHDRLVHKVSLDACNLPTR